MANTSILAAFERMWLHITTALSGKADIDHSHNEATKEASGLLSASDKIQLDYGGIPIVTTEGTGAAYTAVVDGMTSLTNGMRVTIIPHTISTTTNPTLNVNGLGAKYIRMPVTYNTSSGAGGAIESWLVANKPVTLMYNGTYWLTVDLPRPSALYLSGTVPVTSGGTGVSNVTSGNFLVGNGAEAMTQKTPAEVLSHLGVTATATELNYMDGVTDNVQTQLDSKFDKNGGTLTGAINVNGAASMDGNGYVTGSWIRMTADTALGSTPTEGICVKQNGWIYTRTPAQILSDIEAAPAYTYGTTDLTAGSSQLETGKLYFVYE